MFDIIKVKDFIQDCNVNFLIGSGLSKPYLSTLGNIETLLTQLTENTEIGFISPEEEILLRASIYKKYFDETIRKNLELINEDEKAKPVLDEYKNFLKTVNSIILRRKSTILSKQTNLFTTNLDIFLEKALEETKLEYNDGFFGRFYPIFDLTNFKKSVFKTSLHYDNIAEVPVFNLMKIHGSLTWEKDDNDEITFSFGLQNVRNVNSTIPLGDSFINIDKLDTIETLRSKIKQNDHNDNFANFITEYEKLAIVNPTKEKFKETVLNQNYYDLLRIYANEMEKENTILFVLGFSFADEHIRDMTKRVLNSNPTLKLFFFSYSNTPDEGATFLLDNTKNNNVEIITPQNINSIDEDYRLDFHSLNQDFFLPILEKIDKDFRNIGE